MVPDVLFMLLGLIGVLFIHELGHLIAARWLGFRVTSIAIGFGPEICGLTDRFGTRWKLAALPVGGFCSLDEATAERRAIRQRAVCFAAGPIVNIVFAIAVYLVAATYFGEARLWTIAVLGTDAALPMIISALSMFVAVINLIPLPPMDGGRLLLLGIEAIRGNPISHVAQSFLCLSGISVQAVLTAIAFLVLVS
jgi:membrane-associated protease RseP (regulator of RpoE activity)